MDTSAFELIEKENIPALHFDYSEVLQSESARKERRAQLDRAISLGNLEHYKVKIYFSDDTGDKVVHTTIWGITDDAILLKQNVILPIHKIKRLEI